MKANLLGVKIDKVTFTEASETIQSWLKRKGKHYIVTPNIEMIIDAKSDPEFKKALNQADLSIPDSSRLGWGIWMSSQTNPILKITAFPFFIFPQIIPIFSFPVVTGTDLMDQIISVSAEKGYTIGLLGAKFNVAEKLKECLFKQYPRLKIVFASGNIKVDKNGHSHFITDDNNLTESKEIKLNPHDLAKKMDILFVAFGHKKQEKWILKNLPKLNTKVMMGVGGAFDYLSGNIPRAPQWIRGMGFEWLFRIIIQPWRIFRFYKLVKFIILVFAKT